MLIYFVLGIGFLFALWIVFKIRRETAELGIDGIHNKKVKGGK
jgi:hypothetical protein